MTDSNNTPNRIFKIGATIIVADEQTAQMDNEQVRALLKRTYPEVAHATIREQTLEDGTVVISTKPCRQERVNMTTNDLRDVLLGLPELSLIGTGLLEDTTGFFPVDVPRDTLREAVVEMVAYTESCQSAARRLRDLTPIPLTVEIPEYGIMTALLNYQSTLAAAVDADPVLRLAHAAAWLDPLMGVLDDENIEAAAYAEDPDAAVTMALHVTRRNFPDVYIDMLNALRTGQSYNAIDTLVCTAFNQKGIPLDSLEWLGWGIPLPAYGVELDDPDFWTTHPDAAPVLACFGVSPEPNPYRIEVPDVTYRVADAIANSLREQSDSTWKQTAELIEWLFGISGNSAIALSHLEDVSVSTVELGSG